MQTPQPDQSKSDLSFLYLQTALIQIDILIMHAVRRWQQAQHNRNQEQAGILRGHYISDAEINSLLKQPLGTSWWQGTIPTEGDFAELQQAARRRMQSISQTALEQNTVLRLEHLVTTFGLSELDLGTFLICLAPALDRRYERFYGYLQDDATRKWPTVNLILDLLGKPDPTRLLQLVYFSDDAPLLKFHLLVPVREPGIVEPAMLNQALRPDRTVVNWLLGRYQPHPQLGDQACLIAPQDLATDRLLAGDTLHGLRRVIAEEYPIFAFYGRDEIRQRATARQLAVQLKRSLLMVDLAAVTNELLPPLQALRLTLRDARLAGAIPYLTNWHACLKDDAPLPEVFSELCAYPDLAIVANQQKWQPKGINRDHHLVWLKFPLPSYGQRYALWQHFLAAEDTAETLDIAALSGQFNFTSGQIRDAVASAKDRAIQRDGPLQKDDLFVSARTHSNPNLATLARKIETRYQWQDIILPDDQITVLRELISTVRERPKVLEEWQVGQKLVSSAGITALFTGQPGTGKTMAAEVIANELKLDLYKIDLSTVVSKYVGETEKNLEKVFIEAETSNAILFFDEADALFGKRSEVRDAHDRYANIEISYLLQRMEAYNGVTILATNLRANLDDAFTRRLQFVVDFPFPEEQERLQIWQTLFPETVPRHPEVDFTVMARRFKLAGGNIRNIIVTTAYLAAADGNVVTMRHLLHGTRRELQKMGRMMNEQDLIID